MRSFIRPLLLIAGLAAAAPLHAADPHAALLQIDGAIGPASSGYFQKAHAKAVESGASIIVLQIDTPGGLDSAMREIIKTILNSSVPVACWVGPGGARAASAGTYIMYACHVAAMAPATNLGAATPVPVGGSWPVAKPDAIDGDDDAKKSSKKDSRKEEASAKKSGETVDAMQQKALNDAVAYIRSLAAKRGRNASWAEAAVREGRSVSAEEALKLKVVDLIADDVPDLLKKIDGLSVTASTGETKLRTASLPVEKLEPDWRMKLLAVITNPTIAYVLMLIGIYGLLLEGYHPGAFLPGITGAICLLLAMYAFQVLPVNYVGLALMILGVVLMIAEAFAPTFGALGFGGIIAFVLGSIMLMDIDVPGYGVNRGMIAGIAVGSAGLLALTMFLLYRARRSPVITGDHMLIGRTGEVLPGAKDLEGWVLVAGERWRVRSEAPIETGQRVKILRVEGMTLHVKPK